MDTTTPGLTVIRTDVEPCRVKLDIEVPVERVRSAYAHAAELFNRSARVPGFRPGKTPDKLVRRRYAKEIAEQVKQQLLREIVQEAVESQGLEPETSPRVENESAVQALEDAPFVCALTFDISPEFELPEYKGLTVVRDSAEVGEDSVDEVIDGWLKMRVQRERVDGPAKRGYLLKATYRGVLPEDDEPTPETARFLLEQEDAWLSLQEPALIPGITAVLEGVEAGEQREADIRFPDDFAPRALAGKTVHYTFDVSEVHISRVPELDDELAQEAGAENVEEMRARVKQRLAAQKEEQQHYSVREQILRALFDSVDFPLPPTVLRRQASETLRRLYEQARYGVSTPDELNERIPELTRDANAHARRELKRYYLLRSIAEAENITLEERELAVAVARLSEAHGISAKVMARRLRESGRLGELVISMRESKTLDRLVEWADVSTADGEQNVEPDRDEAEEQE